MSTHPASASRADAPVSTAAVVCVLAALVLVVLDAAIVNVALPAVGEALNVSPAAAVYVVTAYQLALVMGLMPSAALGESRGHRRVYAAGVALFTAASALCAAASTLPALVVARFVQGLGGAAVMALGMALLRQVLPQERLGRAIGWSALAIALASAAGPSVGSLVLSACSWPWLFAVNLPLGVAVWLLTRSLPAAPGSGRALDLVGFALNALVFGSLVLAAEWLPTHRWAAAGLFALGASSAWLLVRRELPRAMPLVPFDLLRARSLRVSVIASVCCFVGQSAAMVSLPFYVQGGLADHTLHTGLAITPWPLTVAVVGPLTGRLTGRVSGAWLCAAGGTLLAAGLALLAALPLAARPYALVPVVAACGAGFGMFQVANNRNLLLSAPSERSAAAGGLQATARLTGQTLGGVLMTFLFSVCASELAPRRGLALAACATFAAALVSVQRAARCTVAPCAP